MGPGMHRIYTQAKPLIYIKNLEKKSEFVHYLSAVPANSADGIGLVASVFTHLDMVFQSQSRVSGGLAGILACGDATV